VTVVIVMSFFGPSGRCGENVEIGVETPSGVTRRYAGSRGGGLGWTDADRRVAMSAPEPTSSYLPLLAVCPLSAADRDIDAENQAACCAADRRDLNDDATQDGVVDHIATDRDFDAAIVWRRASGCARSVPQSRSMFPVPIFPPNLRQ
jgi:hypothetical protein